MQEDDERKYARATRHMPAHVTSRNAAIEDAFAVLSEANGVPPPPSADVFDVESYLASLERECVRELFAKISTWRVPQPEYSHQAEAWRYWPLPRGEDIKDLFECLVLLGSVDRHGTVTLNLHILHPKRKELHLSEISVSLAAVLGSSDKSVRDAEAVVRSKCEDGGDFVFASLDYIGDLTSTLVIARTLKGTSPTRGVIHAILPGGPRVIEPWIKPAPLDSTRDIPLNESQHAALSSLSTNMELISGPPGTGKSTTIHALVTECVPPDELVVLTAVQNRAVEALVEKFSKTKTPFIVSGRRVQGEALKWTLDAQVSNDPAVRDTRRYSQSARLLSFVLRYGLDRKRRNLFREIDPAENSHRATERKRRVRKVMEEATIASSSSVAPGFLSSQPFRSWKEEYQGTQGRSRCKTPPAQRALKELVEEYAARTCGWSRLANAVLKRLYVEAHDLQHFLDSAVDRLAYLKHTAEEAASTRITANAKALMCTSAAIGPALRDVHLSQLSRRATTVIGDEAGTLGDRHMLPIVFNCPNATRVVLVGDTKQLPVFSYIRGEQSPQSMMERLERDFAPSMLTIQYRMPPRLASVVSQCFYDGRLTSASREKVAEAVRPMRFISIEGTQRPERRNATSMVNEAEANAACGEANQLARQNPEQTVAILTPYAAQVSTGDSRVGAWGLHPTLRSAIETPNTQNSSLYGSSSRPQVRFMQKLLKHENVEAMTVDGSQGREWDHVLLSLVRTERDGTFVNDPRRQCVAMSRAKLSMILVAHPALAAALPHLRKFWDHATTFELLARPITVQARPPRHAPSATRRQAEPVSAHEQEDSGTAYLKARLQKLKPDSTMEHRWSAVVRVIEGALVLAPGDDELPFLAVKPTGSYATSTNVRGKSDLDVVVTVRGFEPLQTSSYLETVQRMLRDGNINIDKTEMGTKSFQFTLNGIEVDVLVGGEPESLQEWPACLVEMDDTTRLAWRHSYSFKTVQMIMELTLPDRQPLGRDVVMLAKDWRDEIKWEGQHTRPSSFLLLLLTFHALEQEERNTGQKCESLLMGFELLLQSVVDYDQIFGTWNGWFAHTDIPASMSAMEPPLLLDPSDPTNNVANTVDNWESFANEAKDKLAQLSSI